MCLQVHECDWVQCVDPPVPAGLNLKTSWDGMAGVEFGGNVTYSCNGSDYFFDHDKENASFAVVCLEGGRWQLPPEWPKCVKCMDMQIS